MTFSDALQDTVTINTISVCFKSGDSIGQQVKTKTALYSNVKGRLNKHAANFSFSLNSPGKQEHLNSSWILEMETHYNGANNGDEVIANGITFIITKKHEIRGKSSTVHHVVYFLQQLS